MQYRDFGKLDWKASALGFGAMRLPLKGKEPTDIDEDTAIRMIRYAIDHGVNYLDTAYPYHGGVSERVVGRALKDGYRERIKLQTKLPCGMVEAAGDFDRLLNEQLERLDTGIDFYLLHGLSSNNWSKVRDMGVIDWAEKAMADGRFGRLGFSFHDNTEVFKDIVDAYDNWVLSQIQYNFMDVEFQAGRSGVEYAAARGVAVVAMEPVRGGRLARAPESVATVWESASQPRTPVEWALQWVLNQPEVAVALSGMSTMEQVVENVEIAERSGPGSLGADELAVIDRAREAYRGLVPVPCTYCRYCMPCPHGVNIPRVFGIFTEAMVYGDFRGARGGYRGLKEEERGDRCIECHECLEACPQQIDIPDLLKKAHEVLSAEE